MALSNGRTWKQSLIETDQDAAAYWEVFTDTVIIYEWETHFYAASYLYLN